MSTQSAFRTKSPSRIWVLSAPTDQRPTAFSSIFLKSTFVLKGPCSSRKSGTVDPPMPVFSPRFIKPPDSSLHSALPRGICGARAPQAWDGEPVGFTEGLRNLWSRACSANTFSGWFCMLNSEHDCCLRPHVPLRAAEKGPGLAH